MKVFISSVYFTWAILALPSIPVVVGIANGADLERLLHPSGEFSARFMILSLMVTPLALVFKNSKAVRWLRFRRRAIGVAAFCYAFVHTLLYIVDIGSLQAMLDEFWKLGIWTGWLAFAIFIPLAITSNNGMVRKLKGNWKPLHRWVYGAAILTLLHWIYIKDEVGPVIVHFLPLALLQLYRVYYYFQEQQPAASN